MNTNLAIRESPSAVALFPGAGPGEIVRAAADVADTFSDIVKKQRMFKRIGDRDHILIEAWQTIGTLTGVFATEAGGVREIPWPPMIEPLGTEPEKPGPEPRSKGDTHDAWESANVVRRQWELHKALLDARTLGKAFGYAAAFRAVKNGAEVGWGEGRVLRTERTWTSRDDYALASMAQTRGQSRALGAPLRFIVKLANYEPTLPDDVDGSEPLPGAPAQPPALPWGPVADDQQEQEAADLVRAIAMFPGPLDIEAEKFVIAMGRKFDGVPAACVTMLRGLVRFLQAAHAVALQPENAPPEPEQSAYHAPPAQSTYRGPDPNVVYPPAESGQRLQGD
jgi:hypothetical protein